MSQAEPVLLSFDEGDGAHARSGDLSAVVQVEDDLWLGSDEGTALDRLSPLGDGGYGRHMPFDLADVLALPGKSGEEIDVEGLALDGGCLWVAGSHSRSRRKPNIEPGDEPTGSSKELNRLAKARRGGNQYLLARVPLVRTDDGRGLVPVAKGPGGVRAARLPGGRRRNLLMDQIRKDDHLRRFLKVPGKDNGFNVEGLAVADGRAFLGLRGPVLGGWAIVLVLAPEVDPDDPRALRLEPVGGKKRLYRKLFLDLHGLGIRDLRLDGADLLVLAGPTMPLDGDAVVLRWREALGTEQDVLVPRDRLERILDLPYGRGAEEGVDHPEGLAVLREGASRSLLVVYDSPSDRRRQGTAGIVADRFRL